MTGVQTCALPIYDYGSYVNLELYTPDFAPLFKVVGPETKFRGVLFHDYGHVVRNGPAVTDQFRVTASSVGVGLRISHGNSLTIRLDGAWTNKPSHINPTDTPATLPGATRNFRMHGALVYLF